MPVLAPPQAAHYLHVSPTKEDLDYANLAIIDLAKGTTPEGCIELARQVRDAMANVGFFYVVNHGYSVDQRDRIFDIADIPFSQVNQDDKQPYVQVVGSYQGYKLRQYWHIDGGITDQIEHYNINRDVTKRQHPQALRPFLPEIEAFAKHNHFSILHTVLRLLAIGLELPEDALVNMHDFRAAGESSVRFMKYYPRSQAEEVKTKNVWLKGHTDIGSITLLWSQPVAGLQILTEDGRWKWIKHVDNAIVVNAGDAIEFLSGGYYRATIHRVVQPPPDQRNLTRLGVFYFAMANDDVILNPLVESPVLQRIGITKRLDEDKAPTMEQWRKSRTTAYGRSQLKVGAETGVEEEVIEGVLVKHYN